MPVIKIIYFKSNKIIHQEDTKPNKTTNQEPEYRGCKPNITNYSKPKSTINPHNTPIKLFSRSKHIPFT